MALAFAVLASLVAAAAAADASTIFSILFTPSTNPNHPSPEEYFTDLQLAFAAATAAATAQATGGVGGGLVNLGVDSLLGKADPTQDFSAGRMDLIVCELEPFWEKGAIVYRLQDCPLSKVRLVVYSLVPAVAMLFGMLGLWSRQRNVRGRGKDTQVGSVIGIGLSLLSVSYNWFFSWTVFRSPRGNFQATVSEVGLAHLITTVVLNFLLVHFWFRRKFLIGMPWYEYHKHGLGLHGIFFLMYLQPQCVTLFQSRLFDIDLFNIHFGTPSKMNETLSNMACLSLLQDVPQICLQFAVWVADLSGMQVPGVTRISMILSVLSIAMTVKRQYIATVERQWYKEIVRMAGVRRLTTYGGASRWLKFQKRPSAAADVNANASTAQQQLFLAWMQSMGRRQDSIFQDAAKGKPKSSRGPGDDGRSEADSEDELDSVSSSEESDSDEPRHEKGSKRPGDDEGVDSESDVSMSDEGSQESGRAGREEGPVELQSHRRPQHAGADVAHEGASGISMGASGILGFARDIAMQEASASGVPSESDVFAFAKHVAGHVSESGVVTDSHADLSGDDSSVGGNSLLRFARNVAAADSDAGTSIAGTDALAFARQVARDASESGAEESAKGSDIFAFARQAARDVSQSGVGTSAVALPSVFHAARQESPDGDSEAVSGASTDIFAMARHAAAEVSETGASAASRRSGAPRRTGPPKSSRTQGHDAASEVSEASDIFAAARRAAAEVSVAGTSAAGSRAGMPDLFARARPAGRGAGRGADEEARSCASSAASEDVFGAARAAAAEVSESNFGGRSAADTNAGLSEVFGAVGQSARGGRTQGRPSDAASDAESDIFAVARRAAADASVAGTSAASAARSRAGGFFDFFAPAPRAPVAPPAPPDAWPEGRSAGGGVQASSRAGGDLFAAARAAASRAARAGGDVSRRGGGEWDAQSDAASDFDVFAMAQGVAQDASRSGVASSVGRAPRGLADLAGARRPPHADASEAGSDIFGSARRAADAASGSGVQSDIFASVRQAAADAASASGVGSDIFRAARAAADELSRSGLGDDDQSDIFGAALAAAVDASTSGVGSRHGAGGVAGARRDFEFAPQSRRFAPGARHARAPPADLDGLGRPLVPPLPPSTDDGSDDPPPWAGLALLGVPPPPPPPRRPPPSPPGDAPPFPDVSPSRLCGAAPEVALACGPARAEALLGDPPPRSDRPCAPAAEQGDSSGGAPPQPPPPQPPQPPREQRRPADALAQARARVVPPPPPPPGAASSSSGGGAIARQQRLDVQRRMQEAGSRDYKRKRSRQGAAGGAPDPGLVAGADAAELGPTGGRAAAGVPPEPGPHGGGGPAT